MYPSEFYLKPITRKVKEMRRNANNPMAEYNQLSRRRKSQIPFSSTK